ncbi:MAG: acyltransferase family protein [Lachnospiraceae bacterium]
MKEKLQNITWNIFSKYKAELYGITILWIMIFHSYLNGIDFYTGENKIFKALDLIIENGNIGTDMFLFLSGIFCYYSLIKNDNYFEYTKRKIAKLLPTVLLITGIYWLLDLVHTRDVWKFLLRVTLCDFWVTGDQQIWFVSLIMLCYLFYPFIFWIVYKAEKYEKTKAVILFLLVLIFPFAIMNKAPEMYSKIEIAITRIPVFVLGSLVGKFCYDKKKINSCIFPICIVGVISSIYFFHTDPWKGIYGRYFYMCGILWLFFFGIVLYLLDCRWLNNFFSFFGKISLELYISHILIRRIYVGSNYYRKGCKRDYLLILFISVCFALLVSRIQKACFDKRKSIAK